jgi:hypothetical protein
MTDDPLKRYLDDFGAQLERAARAPVRRRPRRRPLIALAGGVTAAGLLIALVLLGAPGGSSRLNLVAQARAALTPPGRLVHAIVTQRLEVAPGHPDVHVSAPPQTTEQWSTADPPRWRIAFSYPDPRKHRGAGTVGDAHGPIVGTVQIAHAGTEESTYYQQRNTLRIVRGLPNQARSVLPGVAPLGNDPIGTLREMLQTGRLRDGGTATVDGRQVRRLVGETHRRFGHKRVTTSVEYDVDPATFAPVLARIELPFPSSDGTPAVTAVLRFERFELLPLTAGTRRLLDIQPVGHPKVQVVHYRARHRPAAAKP